MSLIQDSSELVNDAVSSDDNGEKLRDENIFTRLRKGMEELSAMQQQVCSYVIENYQNVAFITVEELSGLCGASPATVVRTVKALGYGSYHEMQKEFQKMLLGTKASLWWELEQSWDETGDDCHLPWVAKDNIEAIQNILTQQLMDNYGVAVDMLMKARKIFIVGMRSTRAAATFFFSMLNQLLPNVDVVREGADTLYDDLVDLGSEDVLFCISLGGPHYAKTTVNAMAFASRNSIQTILITNSPSAAAVEYADLVLYVPSASRHYSLVPCLTLLESLVVSIGQQSRDRAQKKLRKLEEILVNENVTF